MTTASYIVGGIGITAIAAAQLVRALRRAGETLNALITEYGDINDVPIGEDEEAGL